MCADEFRPKVVRTKQTRYGCRAFRRLRRTIWRCATTTTTRTAGGFGRRSLYHLTRRISKIAHGNDDLGLRFYGLCGRPLTFADNTITDDVCADAVSAIRRRDGRSTGFGRKHCTNCRLLSSR